MAQNADASRKAIVTSSVPVLEVDGKMLTQKADASRKAIVTSDNTLTVFQTSKKPKKRMQAARRL